MTDRSLLQQSLDAHLYHRDQTRPIDRTDAVIDALRAALAAPVEPVAWRWRIFEAGVWGDWRTQTCKPQGPPTAYFQVEPLYATPQAQPAPAVPDDAALNTLARVFHSGEEIEGDDGAAMMVDMALWNEGCEALESLIGDGDGETLASSAAPAVPDPWRMAVDAAMVGHALDCTTPESDPEKCVALLCKQVADIEREIAAPAAPAVREPLSREQRIAIREAHCNTAADEYFGARPAFDDAVFRRFYEAGFKEGWESGITGDGK